MSKINEMVDKGLTEEQKLEARAARLRFNPERYKEERENAAKRSVARREDEERTGRHITAGWGPKEKLKPLRKFDDDPERDGLVRGKKEARKRQIDRRKRRAEKRRKKNLKS